MESAFNLLQSNAIAKEGLLLSALFDELFNNLRNNREVKVLKIRYGLENDQSFNTNAKRKATLQSIGKQEGITRERVRQIENSGIKNLTKLEQYQTALQRIIDHLHSVLDEHAGVMSEDNLIEKSLNHIKDAKQRELESRYMRFSLHKLLNRQLVSENSNDLHHKVWAKKPEHVEFIQNALKEIYKTLEQKGTSVTLDDLIAEISESEFFKTLEQKITKQVLENLLISSSQIESNPFNEWGFKHWADIVPKRIGDKIYLVLKKHGKPLHYKKIAEKIEEYNFDPKKAHSPTIHNELILDDRYVLVGRGIYALKDWGFKSGVITDLLEDILKESARGEMAKEEIMQEIMKQRRVKDSTIYLALSDKSKFIKTHEGAYRLIKS